MMASYVKKVVVFVS